jgi:hypothetical protein
MCAFGSLIKEQDAAVIEDFPVYRIKKPLKAFFKQIQTVREVFLSPIYEKLFDHGVGWGNKLNQYMVAKA